MADSFDDSASEGPTTAAAPYRIGGNLRPPRKIRDVAPAYPEIAQRIHVAGDVVIDCLIDEQGRVREASVLRGHPLLAPAAVAAVERWAYEPSLLNGVPVQVLMTVTVHFQLK
jgi:protein TonB